MNRTLVAAGALMGALTLGACSETAMDPMGSLMAPTAEAPNNRPDFAGPKNDDPSIAAIATAGGFTQLLGALAYVDDAFAGDPEYTPLVPLFSEGKDQFTVFAPTNQAFEDLLTFLNSGLGFSFTSLDEIPADLVLDILFYHVAEGRRASNSVVPKNGERTMTSLLGEDFFVRVDEYMGMPEANIRDGLSDLGVRDDATITGPDNSANNGIVHVIDAVIVPPSVVETLLELSGS